MPSTITTPGVAQAAARLAAAARTRTPCPPVRDLIAADNLAAAYMVQTRNVDARIAAGRRVVGRKIGLTSPAVQTQLGVDQPDFGVLFDDMDCGRDPCVRYQRLLQPKMEAEIAFTLAHDVTDEVTAETAPALVNRVFAAFEIVDSRIANWDISIADTIADNASSGLYVLGDAVAAAGAPNLESVRMTMCENGAQVSSGVGSDCLGSPWRALAWLANTAIGLSAPLRAGDVVLSGALGPMVPVWPGATYTASITGIGGVSVTFSA
jgi:2-keto-4-pentenoate hydratase